MFYVYSNNYILEFVCFTTFHGVPYKAFCLIISILHRLVALYGFKTRTNKQTSRSRVSCSTRASEFLLYGFVKSLYEVSCKVRRSVMQRFKQIMFDHSSKVKDQRSNLTCLCTPMGYDNILNCCYFQFLIYRPDKKIVLKVTDSRSKNKYACHDDVTYQI